MPHWKSVRGRRPATAKFQGLFEFQDLLCIGIDVDTKSVRKFGHRCSRT